MLMLMSLTQIYAYMYTMIASSALGLLPVFGGALFMCCRITTVLYESFFGRKSRALTPQMRALGVTVLILMLVCALILLTIYPILLDNARVWILFTIALAFTLRMSFARRLTRYYMQRRLRLAWYAPCMALIEIIPCAVVFWLLSNTVPAPDVWYLLLGFAVSALPEGYTLWRERGSLAQEPSDIEPDPEAVIRASRELREVHAYASFERIHTLILIALQLTLVMVYTFIGLTTKQLITCLILSICTTILMRALTELLLRKIKRRRPFVTQLLLIGLFMWVYGLTLFYRLWGEKLQAVPMYLSLGLSMGGLTIAVGCLANLENRMQSVAAYSLGDHMEGYQQMRAAKTELAIAGGQMIALILMTIICMTASPTRGVLPDDIPGILASFRPLMILPPILLIIGAALCVIRFPMNKRHFLKLDKFLSLSAEGGSNPPLQKQLDTVVKQRHKNRFGVKIIIALLRPLYYHKVLGTENVSGYEDGTMILVCNHGELYGPVVANLYIPISFRPWVLDEMMEKDAVVSWVYNGTTVRQKWCPDRLKMPLTRLVCRFIVWVMRSIDAIPVYRNQPRELLKTFRITIEAMQAGDNILIFPENSALNETERFLTEGVGRFYTGFAMLAPTYYAKTKRRAVFVPVYASKALRTVTLGKGIVYDPDKPQTDEKLRIVEALEQEMESMYQVEKAELGKLEGTK